MKFSSNLDYLVLAVMGFYLATCPWTRVEESFNTQAIHDILFLGPKLSEYDHQEFPGVVPRSFLGSAAVAAFSLVPKTIAVDALRASKVICLFIARSALGLSVFFTFRSLVRCIRINYGKDVGNWLVFITVSQFHFLFYATRFLPNMFAVPLVLMATTAWMYGDDKRMIKYACLAMIIFRSELCLLFGPMLLISLYQRTISVPTAVFHGLKNVSIALALTIIIDSYFWRRPLWPEGEVLWFNTVKNQSSNWGTSPYLWYFYSVIPRLLLASSPLCLYGVAVNRSIRIFLLPFLTFVALYSFLPHKELRFIIYTAPVLNFSAAVSCALLWKQRSSLLKLIVVSHIGLNIILSLLFLSISSRNYSGGDALYRLHQLESPKTDVHVFLDNFSLQNGISRFLHLNHNWVYDKSDAVSFASPTDFGSFTHVIAEAKYQQNLFTRGFEHMESFYSFSHFNKTIPRLNDLVTFNWNPFIWTERLHLWRRSQTRSF
ncbi:hypothetical protein RvY_01570 [Ramazzottius varieornatus]|uniref:Mannosyltransferase n=1 Tax=Ramazzottius varieornatus TaxID=947166 RepID=A0A1D1UGU0_RAMVA|nr:hypothetical protein RvY_01570 [Ramazzottius varieornatus]